MEQIHDGKIRHIFYEYMSNATIHGFSRIIGTKLYSWRRLLWTLVVLGSAVALSALVYKELSFFYSRPTFLKEYLSRSGPLDIPSITLCPLKAFGGTVETTEEAPTAEQMIIQKLMYPLSHVPQSFLATLHHSLFGWNQDKRLSSFNSYTFFKNLGIQLPNNISERYIAGLPELFHSPLSGNLLQELTNRSQVLLMQSCPAVREFSYSLKCCDDIVSEVMTEVGKCQTVNVTALAAKESTKRIIDGDSVILIINVDMPYDNQLIHPHGLNIIVHSPYEPPLPTARGTFVPSATIATVNVGKTTRLSLGPPYTNPDGQTCTHDTQNLPTLTRFPEFPYSAYTCRRECLVNNTTKHCGCRHPWDPGDDDVCSIMDIYNCIWATIDDNSLLTSTCDCPQPCETSEYDIILDYSPLKLRLDRRLYARDDNGIDTTACERLYLPESNTMVAIDVKFPTSVRVLEQRPVKAFADVLSSLGGLIGLFLGFSIISLFEFTEVILLTVRVMCAGRQRRKVEATGVATPTAMEKDNVDIEEND